MQAVYTEALIYSGNPVKAARLAGYTDPYVAVHTLKSHPGVIEEVRRRQNELLYTDGLPAAVGFLVTLVKDEKASNRDRTAAAKIILDRTVGSTEAGQPGKDLHQMTAQELEAHRAKLELELAAFAELAKDVTPPPDEGIFG